MAAVCEVCGKHPSWGMSVSHSHRRTKRRWNPNIQRVRAVVDGAPKRVHQKHIIGMFRRERGLFRMIKDAISLRQAIG